VKGWGGWGGGGGSRGDVGPDTLPRGMCEVGKLAQDLSLEALAGDPDAVILGEGVAPQNPQGAQLSQDVAHNFQPLCQTGSPILCSPTSLSGPLITLEWVGSPLHDMTFIWSQKACLRTAPDFLMSHSNNTHRQLPGGILLSSTCTPVVAVAGHILPRF
jgi:hypothetical protein